jgi:hypothetical protein
MKSFFALMAVAVLVAGRKIVVREHEAYSIKLCLLTECRSALQQCSLNAVCFKNVQECIGKYSASAGTPSDTQDVSTSPSLPVSYVPGPER